MTSGRFGFGHTRFDPTQTALAKGPSFPLPPTETRSPGHETDIGLRRAIERTRDRLLAQQHDEGFWVGELEGDSILESEYILLLAYLGQEQSETARRCADYLLEKQLPEGGWAIYPGGPLEISASVKAYFALKLTGHRPDAEPLVRARRAILDAGGAEGVNSFTRYYLALLGVLSYDQCPAVPPELILLPRWAPFNVYEMSAWSRTIVIPLSILWAHRPFRRLPEELGIRELFVHSPEQLPITMAQPQVVDDLARPTRIDWHALFRRLDRAVKWLERKRIRPLRRLALRSAGRWMIRRFEQSDGLGAIFPPIVWSVVALKCLGYGDDSKEVRQALGELDKLSIRDGETVRLEPCKSPVWDTALSAIALREADVPAEHPALRRAVDWLLAKEVRTPGDWSRLTKGVESSGWFFEFNNAFYPDVDDTGMVLIALCRCLPDGGDAHWSADILLNSGPPSAGGSPFSAVVSGHGNSKRRASQTIDRMTPQLESIWRGARWILAMQSRDGGWGAFDRNNNRELFTRVPFADHNAMIDPSTADLTARMLELFADLKFPRDHVAVSRALRFVTSRQESDFCWYGRWGVNYIYGTWQCLVGLTAIGYRPDDLRIRNAAEWLKSVQQPCGGWGETPQSYDDPSQRGKGEPTASQTAWAVLGLLAAGEVHSDSVRRGVDYLLNTQRTDGGWDEPQFTGTGFPRVFYLKYHLYSVYFPLMALARFERLKGRDR